MDKDTSIRARWFANREKFLALRGRQIQFKLKIFHGEPPTLDSLNGCRETVPRRLGTLKSFPNICKSNRHIGCSTCRKSRI